MLNTIKHIISLFAAVILCNNSIFSQSGKQPYNIAFRDSVSLTQGERYTTNDFTFTNNQEKQVILHISLTSPTGWQPLTETKEIKLLPGERFVFAARLAPKPTAKSDWAPFTLHVKDDASAEIENYTFWARPLLLLRYNASLAAKQQQLSGTLRDATIKINLKNTGNVDAFFDVRIQNYFLELRRDEKLVVKPNRDTILSYKVTITNAQWRSLTKETISIRITDSTSAIRLLLFELSKAHTLLKQNNSAYQTIPIELETGTILNELTLTHFGVVKGKLNVREKSNVEFSYRTKEIGVYNQMQSDVFNLKFTSPKFVLFAGQITDAKNFVAFGNGFKANYFGEKTEVYLSGTVHNKNFYHKNDQVEVGVRKKIGDIKVDQSFSANFDVLGNSYILLNKANLINKEGISLIVNSGLGIESTQFSNKKLATAWGYDYLHKLNKVQIISSVQSNSRFFPGVNKGFQNHNHNLSWRGKGVTLSTFYQLNQRTINLFRDSLYNSDFLSFNTKKYGVYTGIRMKKLSISLSTGFFGQYGASNSSSMDKYKYVEGFYFWQPNRSIKTSLSSFNAYGSLNEKNDIAWINSTTAGIYLKRFGLTGLFTRNPQLTVDSGYKRLNRYDETVNITPSVNFSLLKKFFFNLSYTLSQTSYDDKLTSFATTSINYIGKTNGLSASIYTIVPVVRSNAGAPGLNREYFTLSIRKKLDIPILFRRKFYNLKVSPFLDLNNNGEKESGEKELKNLLVNVNGTNFITNRSGSFSYKNIKKGNYGIDLNNAAPIAGYVPANGFVQKVEVTGNTSIEIPYKKSKIINGQITVQSDSLSTTQFTPDGIKVTARDTLNNVFTILSDARGIFSLSVPAGIYVVTLNPEAFDEKLKPEVMAFTIDLTNKESDLVEFIIKQQKRRVRLLKN